MGITFCPAEVAWGDVATWISSAATLLAVAVALVTSQRALDAEHRAHDAERKRQHAEDEALAERLAAVFDHELYLCAGQMSYFADALEGRIDRVDAPATINALTTGLPTEALMILAANTDKLRVFDAATATALMRALSGWNALAARPSAVPLADAPVEYLMAAAGSTLRATRGMVTQENAARTAIRPIAIKVNPRSPPVPE